MKILVLGLDGNILDNYTIKAECAGLALKKNVKAHFGIEKTVDFFSKIYIETSGMNSLQQFKVAFSRVKNQVVPSEVLEHTEKDFRKCLKQSQNKVEVFQDFLNFVKENKNYYILAVTTTVPIDSINNLLSITKLDELVNIICARGGVWQNNKIEYINNFDKGDVHYGYLGHRLQINKKDIIAVSSTRTDIINAKDYGIISIALEHIYNKKKLSEFKPDYIIKDFNKLRALLNKL